MITTKINRYAGGFCSGIFRVSLHIAILHGGDHNYDHLYAEISHYQFLYIVTRKLRARLRLDCFYIL